MMVFMPEWTVVFTGDCFVKGFLLIIYVGKIAIKKIKFYKSRNIHKIQKILRFHQFQFFINFNPLTAVGRQIDTKNLTTCQICIKIKTKMISSFPFFH